MNKIVETNKEKSINGFLFFGSLLHLLACYFYSPGNLEFLSIFVNIYNSILFVSLFVCLIIFGFIFVVIFCFNDHNLQFSNSRTERLESLEKLKENLDKFSSPLMKNRVFSVSSTVIRLFTVYFALKNGWSFTANLVAFTIMFSFLLVFLVKKLMLKMKEKIENSLA